MTTHPDALLAAALTGDPAAYHQLQVEGSAWSRWTQEGMRCTVFVRECYDLLLAAGLLPDTALRVCCAGCNDGRELEEFSRAGYDAEGFDLDPEKVRVAVACGCKAKVGDLHDPPYSSGVYDCVYASEILEHALDQQRACTALGALLKPGGILFIVVPLEPQQPLWNPAHTAHVTAPVDILRHFPGWGVQEPRILTAEGHAPECILVLRRPEAAPEVPA